MNVKCPGCQHLYKVDERKIPENGQRMRCPKCTTSFRIEKDGGVTELAGGGAEKKDMPSVAPKQQDKVPKPLKAPPAKPLPPLPKPTATKGGIPPVPAPASLKKKSSSKSEDITLEVDLPAPVAPPIVDLPARKKGDQTGEVDLPAPVTKPEIDLPAPRYSEPFGKVDLPTPANFANKVHVGQNWTVKDGDLPTPAKNISKPRGIVESDFGEVDLPVPTDVVDLPAPASGVDLPTPVNSVDLPTPFGAIDLPTPIEGFSDLPEPAAGVMDLPVPSEWLEDLLEPKQGVTALPTPVPPKARAPSSELDDLSASGSVVKASESKADAKHVSRIVGSGSTDFGEIDLALEVGGLPKNEDDAVEFDAFPTSEKSDLSRISLEPESASSLEIEKGYLDERHSGVVIDDAPKMPEEQKRSNVQFEGRRRYERQSRRTKIALLGILAVLGLAGGGLYFTPLGPFGVNAISKMLPNASENKILAEAIRKIDRGLEADTFFDVKRSLDETNLTLKEIPDNEDLRLLKTFLKNWIQIRFGADEKSNTVAANTLGGINLEQSESQYAKIVTCSMDLVALKNESVIKILKSQNKLTPFELAVLAEAQIEAGAFSDAEKTANELLSKKKSPRNEYLLARSLIGLHDDAKATTLLQEISKKNPQHVDAELSLAGLMLHDADSDFERVSKKLLEIGQQPSSNTTSRQRARAFSLLGLMFLNKGDQSKATEYFLLSESQNPKDAQLMVGRGHLALLGDDLTGATSYFGAAMNEDPANIDAKLGQAETLLRRGLLADSKQILVEELPNIPKNPKAHFLFGKVEMSLKNFTESEKEFNAAIDLDQSYTDPYIGLFELLMKMGRDSEAMKTLDNADTLVRDTAILKITLADGYANKGDFANAITSLNQALETDPENIKALFKKAQILRKMNKLEDAKAVLKEVEAKAPSYPGLALEQGFLMEISGDVRQALSAYEKVLAANPNDMGAKIRVASALLLVGDEERAKTLLEETLQVDSRSPEANFYLGELFREKNLATEAAIYLHTAVELNEANPIYNLRYGSVLLMMRDMQGALKYFNKAKELEPDLAEVYLRIGEAKLKSGSSRDAIAMLDKALKLDPKLSEAYSLIGDAFDELAEYRSSLNYYLKAVVELPDDPMINFKLGMAQLHTSGDERAIKSFEKAVSLIKDKEEKPLWYPEALYRLGTAQMSMGQKNSAIASFRNYLEVAPEKALDRAEVEANLENLEN